MLDHFGSANAGENPDSISVNLDCRPLAFPPTPVAASLGAHWPARVIALQDLSCIFITLGGLKLRQTLLAAGHDIPD